MVMDILKEGGPVVWLIVGMGVLAFGVFVERALHLHRARIKSEDFIKGIANILRRNNVAEALTICDETPGPVACLVKTAVLHKDAAPSAIRSALDDASVAEVSRMERRLVVVATVAQIAPLVGLLGTVLGMLDTLLVMRYQAPLIQSADLMAGLMKALIATAVGLMVAIPCYAAFNVLVVKIDRIVLDMDRAASEIVAFLASGQAGSMT